MKKRPNRKFPTIRKIFSTGIFIYFFGVQDSLRLGESCFLFCQKCTSYRKFIINTFGREKIRKFLFRLQIKSSKSKEKKRLSADRNVLSTKLKI